MFPVVTYFDIFFNHFQFFNLDARSSAFSLEDINLLLGHLDVKIRRDFLWYHYSESVELAEMNLSELSSLALKSIASNPS